MHGTLPPRGGPPQHLGESRVLAFESGERKSSRAVLMFQQPHQLGRFAGLPEGPFEQRRGGFHFRIVERSGERLVFFAGPALDEVGGCKSSKRACPAR